MGLDGVEMVMALEETFGMEFDESEAEACRTPRDLIRVIAGKVQLRTGASRCLSQAVFHSVRRCLGGVLDVNRGDVRLDTQLEDLVGHKRRQVLWDDIGKSMMMQRRWPSLVRPRWVVALIWMASLLAALSALRLFAEPAAWFEHAELSLVVGLSTLVGALIVGCLTTCGLRSSFPIGCRTVRALVRHVFVAQAPLCGAWTRDEIVAVVRSIIEEQTGASSFSLDSDLVHEIGLG